MAEGLPMLLWMHTTKEEYAQYFVKKDKWYALTAFVKVSLMGSQEPEAYKSHCPIFDAFVPWDETLRGSAPII